MTSRNPTISLRHAGDPAARLTILDRDEMWATPEQERLALPVSALGFWVALRSLPQSIEMREDQLCSRLGLTRHTLHKLAPTLEDHGQLDRESMRDDRGQFALSVWTLHVEPLPLAHRSRRVRKRSVEVIHAPHYPGTAKPVYGEKKLCSSRYKSIYYYYNYSRRRRGCDRSSGLGYATAGPFRRGAAGHIPAYVDRIASVRRGATAAAGRVDIRRP